MHTALAAIFGRPAPWVVGILNITPDSFSDGAKFAQADAAIRHAETLSAGGADIIEVGAESTGPGSIAISAAEECARLKSVLPALSKRFFLSVDTYHAESAKFALSEGAQMINDVSALRADHNMAAVLAESKCLVALMHAKDAPLPHVTESVRAYRNIIEEITNFLRERTRAAASAGIDASRLILDPGMGRFLSLEPTDSWEVLRRIPEFFKLGIAQPLMIGTSRKGFLGGNLHDRDPISQLTALSAVSRGVSFVRTHNPRMFNEFWRVAKTLQFLVP